MGNEGRTETTKSGSTEPVHSHRAQPGRRRGSVPSRVEGGGPVISLSVAINGFELLALPPLWEKKSGLTLVLTDNQYEGSFLYFVK
jgi:hypothetical protein